MEKPMIAFLKLRIETPGGKLRLEVAQVIRLGRPRAEDDEPLGRQLGESEVADDAATRVEHRGEHHASFARGAVGEQPRQPRLRIGTRDLVFCKARDLDDPDPFAHRPALLGHWPVRVRSPECELFHRLGLLGSEPQRLLETEGGAIDRTQRLQSFIDRGAAKRPAGRSSFGNGTRNRVAYVCWPIALAYAMVA